MTDIDIDLADRNKAFDAQPCICAVLTGARRRHPSGVYFQHIPIDPIDEMAVWDFKLAEQKGYFKVDLLHNSIYDRVRDEQHLVNLLTTEPPWAAFTDRQIVSQLQQIGNHFDIVQMIKPQCIEDLAVCIALVRPGKSRLIGRSRPDIDQELWAVDPHESDTDGKPYAYKRSHAIAYAASLIVQLNLMREHGSL